MSVDTIHESMLDGVPDSYQKTVGFPTWDLTRAFAIGAAALQAQIEAEAKKLDVDNLTGDELARFVYQRKGITVREATQAIALLTVTGNGTVKTGDLFASKGGVLFEAAETVTVSGAAIVHVRAQIAGAGGNLPAGTITEMPVTLTGISSCVNETASHDGFDREDDDTLRDRYYEALRNPPTSGNIAHYRMWAREVAGVGEARVFPLARGDNTVDVVLIDADAQPSSDELTAAVQEYIDPGSRGTGEGQAPIGAHCYVEAATPRTITIEVTAVLQAGFDTGNAAQAIRTALTDYLAGIAFQSDYVSYAQISNVILAIDGVVDHTGLTVCGGTENVSVAEREVAVLGEVTVHVAE